MADLGVAGGGRDLLGPRFDLGTLDLDRPPAHPADQVVMVVGLGR